MIEKAKLNYILTDEPEEEQKITQIEISEKKYENYPSKYEKKIKYNINQNLYIIFTSGTTGNPKGIGLSHKNMLNLIYHEKEKTKIITKSNRILQFATMSFDVSYQEIFTALLSTSTLILVQEEIRKDSKKLTNYIEEKKIDTLFIPPAYLRLLTEEEQNVEKFKKNIKNIITAGEQLIITEGIKKLILAGIKIHNHYGPAETHVVTTYIVDENNIQEKPPIGTAISNTQIYILDKYNQSLPQYTIGQIAISGDQVGNGYIENPKLTNEKFITDPYTSEKMYLTGDLGYIDEKGQINYIGRQDFQVKINGFRIELEEIDKVFMNIKSIQNAISIIIEENNKKHIITYYTLKGEKSEKSIYEEIKKKLPNYMIPSRIIKLDKIPLTLNGKIDKKALPKVNLLDTELELIEPKTQEEKRLAKIWSEIFSTKKISTNYNFFAIGGDSLLAIKMSAKIADEFQTEISVKDIFKTPVFSELLNLICINQEKSKNGLRKVEEKEYYPLSFAQKRIYYTNYQIGEDNIVYNLPGAILIKKVLERKRIEEAFNKIIKKHESFRTYFCLEDGEPVQKIKKEVKIKIEEKHEKSENIQKLLDNFPASFDLKKAPLLHISMYILENEKTLILIDTHHIIVDRNIAKYNNRRLL